MRAAVLYRAGGPEVLQFEQVPMPHCGADQVLVQLRAISLEGGDLLARTRTPPSVPHVIGYSGAGTVVEVGSSVTEFKVGEAVTTFGFAGSHAEFRAVHQSCCWSVPEGLDPTVAATVPVAFGTAHDCLFEYGHLQEGQTVLIQGGSGALGLAAIQLANARGARVIATGSSDSRLAPLKEYGADWVVNYRNSDLHESVLSLTGGKGADLVIDPIGGTLLQRSLQILGQKGRLISVGRAAREPMVLDIGTLFPKQQSITGVFFGAEISSPRVQSLIRNLLREVSQGRLAAVVGCTFPLTEAARAHTYAEDPRREMGRVILVP